MARLGWRSPDWKRCQPGRDNPNEGLARAGHYSTVTDFARLRGLSTSVPRARAVW